jgi:hypothetical protein
MQHRARRVEVGGGQARGPAGDGAGAGWGWPWRAGRVPVGRRGADGGQAPTGGEAQTAGGRGQTLACGSELGKKVGECFY